MNKLQVAKICNELRQVRYELKQARLNEMKNLVDEEGKQG